MSIKYKLPRTTAQKQKEIEKLSVVECFALDAYLISKLPAAEKVITAYEFSRPKESRANRQSIYMQARKWINTGKVKIYLQQRKDELFSTEPIRANKDPEATGSDTQVIKRTKNETIEELNELATKTNDPKLKAEILLKISDLEGWKKEQQTTDDNTIRYYLPLRCYQCTHYKAANMTKVKNKPVTD